MSVPGFSVRRPVTTTMLTFIMLILGGVSLSRLQIDLLPSIELPTVTVDTRYEGAGPEVMERLVTQIIEEIIATVPGVEELSSTSEEGRSDVKVRFTWGTEVDAAALDLQATLEDEINELPEDIVRPRVNKFDIDSYPVVLLGISSKLDPVALTRLVEDQIRFRFVRIPGVAQVDLWGGYNREVRVELDPERLKALRLPVDAVMRALQDANLDLPAGKIEQGRYEVTLRAPAEFADLDEIRRTVIEERRGAPVTLGQVATVKDTWEKLSRVIRVNGERGLRVAIRKQAGANTVEVASEVLAEIDRINAAYPQIHIVPVVNQGNFIEQSIRNVANSVLFGGALAVLVLLAFLRNLRSTLIISLAIPISVIATFAMIYLGGFTLNLMTLGGLALGVGMMVDSSVVVLENIFRRLTEDGDDPKTAAVEGAGEVGTAIVASTITTLVIFLPLVFVEGVAGLLFKELALVIVFSLLCSLAVSLSLVPMLAARLLRRGDTSSGAGVEATGATGSGSTARAGGLDSLYGDVIRLALRFRGLTILIALLLLGGSLPLAARIGTEFLPPSDEGEVRVDGETELGTRLDLIDRQTRILEREVFPAVPELKSSVVSVSPNRGGKARGSIRMTLVPAEERERSNAVIAAELRKKLEGRVPGMTIRTRAPQGQFLLDRLLGGDEGLTVEIRGHDLETLDGLAREVESAMADIDGITDVTVSRTAGIPQQEVLVDRAKVADLGLTVRDVTSILETAVAGAKAGEYRNEGNSYRILVQLERAEKRTIDEILGLTLTTPAGEPVALRNVVTTRRSTGPLEIQRKDQQRLTTVTANVAGRDLGSVAQDVQAAIDGVPRPAGYDLLVAGNWEEQQKAFRELLLALGLALILVYMVLACQYESLRDPVIVMVSVPLSAIGVFVTLFLTDTTFNLQSGIGCIMLAGIVVNNAILLVDQAGRLCEDGRPVNEAVIEAGRRRLRPILMTTLTTILALMPLALGFGTGAEAQAPLARAVIGGLAASTLITLVLIPAVFSLARADAPAATGTDES